MATLGFTIILMLLWTAGLAETSYSGESLLKAAVTILNHLLRHGPSTHKVSTHKVCPDYWIRFKESCYYFPSGTFNFNDAKHVCSQYESKLVDIESQAENSFLKNQMRILKDADYWTGLTASNDFKTWIWHVSKTQASFTDWSSISPNNYGGNQKCVFMQKFDFQWNDFSCDEKFNPVCEKNQTLFV